MTDLHSTDRAHTPLGKRGAFEGVARRHGRRRNPARTTPRSSLRPPTNQALHSLPRVVRKVDCSIKGSETPHARAHATHAAERCQSLITKTITPHVLRHTAAMRLLHADVDTTVIALWLGHEQVETTQMYLHADLDIKERALARTKPLDSKPGRYRPPDALLGFLNGL